MARRTRWSEIDPRCVSTALAQCRGEYQRNLVLGRESLSGSTLRGKARRWSGRYAQSSGSLLRRLRLSGLDVSVCTAEHGARVLVVRPCVDK